MSGPFVVQASLYRRLNYSDPFGLCVPWCTALAGAAIGGAGAAIGTMWYNHAHGQPLSTNLGRNSLIGAGAGAAVGLGYGLIAGGSAAGAGVARVTPLVAPAGAKLAQMIGRWHNELAGSGGREEFMEFANAFVDQARNAGQVATGAVGEIAEATIYRVGNNYLVVDAANKMRSFVANAEANRGIVNVYESLGGK